MPVCWAHGTILMCLGILAVCTGSNRGLRLQVCWVHDRSLTLLRH